MTWKVVAASVIGADHVRAAMPNQDAARVQIVAHPDGERLVVAVADGAGSARHAEVGARLACETAVAWLASEVMIVDDATLGGRLVAAVQAAIAEAAATSGTTPRDHACTLLAAVVAPDWAAFVHVGDGGIVIAEPTSGSFGWIFWPDKGEHANETSFVTGASAASDLAVAWRRGAVDEVALFSDGLERLALDFQAKTAHPSFFGPMFAAVRALPAGDEGERLAAERDLAGFLGSARVNERTSDDKTLVLATRRGP
ncbi:MAG: protein phosphatase 2C domain-containing protein [Deltaproteobacteria bacterium]|nr:protein phosphatase 2C domain-containing protein [Deltaproteobacteria bacterium]